MSIRWISSARQLADTSLNWRTPPRQYQDLPWVCRLRAPSICLVAWPKFDVLKLPKRLHVTKDSSSSRNVPKSLCIKNHMIKICFFSSHKHSFRRLPEQENRWNDSLCIGANFQSILKCESGGYEWTHSSINGFTEDCRTKQDVAKINKTTNLTRKIIVSKKWKDKDLLIF